MKKTVPEMLRDAAALYAQRNAQYGDNYKNFGKWFTPLVAGIKVNDENDTNRLALILHIATKLSRYIENFNRGGHSDSLDDISVYSMMLRELDESLRPEVVEEEQPADGKTLRITNSDNRDVLNVDVDDELFRSMMAGIAAIQLTKEGLIQIVLCDPIPEERIAATAGEIREMYEYGSNVTLDEPPPICMCGHLRAVHRYAFNDDVKDHVMVCIECTQPEECVGRASCLRKNEEIPGRTFNECTHIGCGCKCYAEAKPEEMGLRP